MREIEPFLNISNLQAFIHAALCHYSHAPAWFSNWLDDLSLRIEDGRWTEISLTEINALNGLFIDGWEPENIAVNRIYKMHAFLGRDTTGMAGF
jgi:hypothetical protein